MGDRVFLEGLNQAQRQAVLAGNGPVLIIAGPGTGKTKTLTARIAYLLEQGTPAADIVALTFTNKAAHEMRERLARLLGNDAGLPKVCTFHALGHDLLQHAGDGRQLADEPARQAVIRGLAKPPAFKRMSVRELSLHLSRAKTSLAACDEPTAQLLQCYEAVLHSQNVHDFDDLLVRTYEVLKSDERQRPAYRFVLVDEFQDTSELQYELLRMLGTTDGIFAIGDPNQSIYAFRGAGTGMFARFRREFPAVQTISLTQNYRSRPEIITLANAVFPDAPQLAAQTQATGAVQVLHTLNEYSEAAYIIRMIEQGIGGSDLLKAGGDGSRQPRDYAVLYRTHRAAGVLQKAFRASGLPYQIAGEGSPYDQPQTQAVIAVLRAVSCSAEAPVPAVKNVREQQMRELLAAIGSLGQLAVSDLATAVADRLGYEREAIQQLSSMLVQFGAGQRGLAAALRHIDDITNSEFYDPTVNAVSLLTIHASKGLEFEHVFLIAAEESILPKKNTGDASAVAEEKRLFYVAATRAKASLTMLHAHYRGGEQAAPSRFIVTLPSSVLPRATDPDMAALERRSRRRAAKRAQGTLF